MASKHYICSPDIINEWSCQGNIIVTYSERITHCLSFLFPSFHVPNVTQWFLSWRLGCLERSIVLYETDLFLPFVYITLCLLGWETSKLMLNRMRSKLLWFEFYILVLAFVRRWVSHDFLWTGSCTVVWGIVCMYKVTRHRKCQHISANFYFSPKGIKFTTYCDITGICFLWWS